MRGRIVRRRSIILCFTVFMVAAGLGLGLWIRSAHGFSARENPTRLEESVASAVRRFAMPADARKMSNPMVSTPELLQQASHHFADHCASCHGNDGSGNTEIGRGLFPRAPDMRLQATQSLSDGELYYIIHNGIRMSGMPAWGPESGHDHESWALVDFIRRLPHLTGAELEEMKRYNPRSPAELLEEKEEEEFLNEK
jgi:mono/diheme cytochrome c family protein